VVFVEDGVAGNGRPARIRELIEKLVNLKQLSPDVRFGQLPANLGFLVECQTDHSRWEVEDDPLLEINGEAPGPFAATATAVSGMWLKVITVPFESDTFFARGRSAPWRNPARA
jgi:hypothetical protein